MKKALLATFVLAAVCSPISAFADDDDDNLLALIQDLQAQIDAIQLIPGPQGPEGPAGPAGPSGPAGSGGGAQSFEYVGTAGILSNGAGGLGVFSRACHVAFADARMCTSEEVIRTVNPPQPLGAADFAWVQPILTVTGAGGNLADFSGVSTQGLFGQLSCNGWARSDGSGGLAIALANGTFFQFTCSTQLDVACCAPPASP